MPPTGVHTVLGPSSDESTAALQFICNSSVTERDDFPMTNYPRGDSIRETDTRYQDLKEEMAVLAQAIVEAGASV